MKHRLTALWLATALAMGLAAPAGAEYDPELDRYLSEDRAWVATPGTDGAGAPCLDLWRYDGPGGDVTLPASIDGIPMSGFLLDPYTFNTLPGVQKITSYSLSPAAGEGGFAVRDGVLFSRRWDGQGDSRDLYSYPKASPAKSYTVPKGTGFIEMLAFAGSRNLERVVIPSDIFEVAGSAFTGCASLKTVIFESPVKVGFCIGDAAFADCTSLTSVVLPEGCEPLTDVFRGCDNLRTLLVPGDLEGYVDADAFGLSPEQYPNLTVYGPAGCYMEGYCRYKGIPFQAVDYDALAAEIADEQARFAPGQTPSGQNGSPTGEQPSAWAVPDVEGARAEGLLPSELDGAYTQPITRAEFASLACAFAARMGLRPAEGASPTFPDSTDPDVTRAAALGVITGYADGTFGPDRPIRRDEAAAMLARTARLAGQTPDGPDRTFSDAAAFGWAREDIGFITSCFLPEGAYAVMNGTSARAFGPTGSYTREQAFATFYRLCAYCNRLPTVVLDAGDPLELLPRIEVRVEGDALTAQGGDAVDCRVWLEDGDRTVLLCAEPSGSCAALGAASALSGVIPTGAGVPALDLSNVPDGKYTVWVQTDAAVSYVDIQLIGDDAYFLPPPSYGQNLDFYDSLAAPTQGQYLNVSDSIDWNDPVIRAKASEITAGCTTDYDRAYAIFRWVNQNTSYDWDSYNTSTIWVEGQSASNVLTFGTGVCAGFSHLTAALLRANGIPCRVVEGFSLGYGTNGAWDMTNLRGVNHEWLMAWLDGRWVFIDPTWGQFDRTLLQQSRDHAAAAGQRFGDT